MQGWACAGDPRRAAVWDRQPSSGGIARAKQNLQPVYREESCVSVDMKWLEFKPSRRSFALEVRGDSMIGRHILDGDIVVFEHGMAPKDGDIVAALIDNRNAVKTFVRHKGLPTLRSENPQYPELIPAEELVIQGVAVALVRKRERF